MSDLPETPVSALRMLATTQTEIDRFSDGLIRSVKDGEVNPLEILVMLRAFDKVSKRVLSEIDENYLKEADKYPEKKFELFGASIEKAEVGVEYNYEICGDMEWEKFCVAENTAQECRKTREQFLRNIKEPINILDKDTGEIITINPPIKKSKSGLKVSIK